MRLKKAVIDFVLGKPVLSIILSLILVVGLVPNALKLKPDFSYRIWFMDDDPLLKKFDTFERQFGNDENIAILIHSPNGIFDESSVRVVQQVTEKMWLAPDVIRVDSLSNYSYTMAEGDEMFVDPFLPEEDELTQEYLSNKKRIALSDEVMPRYLISPDGTTAMVYSKMKPALEQIPMYKDTMDYARKIVADMDQAEHKFHIAGSAAINVTFQEVSETDMKTMLPILMLMVVLFLAYSFRGVGGVIYSFLIIGVSILSAFGFAGMKGYTFNVMLSAVPSTLIAICIADVIHVLMSYMLFKKQGMPNQEALRKTLDKNIVPTFLTSVTTTIGFFSIAPAKIVPVAHMGILNGIGTLLAWVFTIFLVLPLLQFLPLKNIRVSEEQKEKGDAYLSPFAIRYTGWIQKYRIAIIVGFIFLIIGSVYFGAKNEVNSDPYNYFTTDVALKNANDTMEKEIGGSMGAELVLDSGVPDGIKNPEFLKKMDQLQSWLLELGYVKKVVSVVDIIKGMNRSLNAGAQDQYILADSQNVIAQQLFLYTMSLPQGMDINNRIDLGNQATRMTIMMNIHDSKTVLAEFERWENYAKSIGLNAHVTGKVPLYQKMNGYIVDTFFESMEMALILVTLVMVIVFRSLKIGLLSMIPNVVPIIIGSGIMYFLKKPIDMGTVVITAVCLGIAVDDTIHFIANYLKAKEKGMDEFSAIASVVTFTGPALLLTTIILVCGFGTMMFASFVPNINFGIMSAIVLTAALIVDFTLLPALLLPKKK